jgi:hypothetical protein
MRAARLSGVRLLLPGTSVPSATSAIDVGDSGLRLQSITRRE